MINKKFLYNLRKEIIGIDTKVPLRSGRLINYINFDNSASTPSFKRVYYKLREFLNWYSNVHRGTGFKSQISTKIYQEARQITADFVGADLEENTLIFVKNTTEAINKLANSLELKEDDIVLTSLMEHHSNLLPWRTKATVKYINFTSQGRLDLKDLELKLKEYQDQLKLVAISGASNVSGYINPIHQIARLAHKYNTQLFIDAAQLAPHRPLNIKDNNDPEHIDYLSFSAHKIYAPFGSGVLIGAKDSFSNTAPDYSGGGTVKAVTLDDVIWAELPDKEEAGTPNIIGAIALAESIKMIESLGWNNIINNEERLLNYTTQALIELEEIELYTSTTEERLGVIPFNITGISDSLVAAILANEGGIGVRNGCFCAHPYVAYLLNLSEEDRQTFKDNILTGDLSNKPGLVRVSFASYNTIYEVNRLIKIIKSIIKRRELGVDLEKGYTLDTTTGEYKLKEIFDYKRYFKI